MTADDTLGRGGRTSPTVVYLAGLGRSGTTLIERALGEISGVTALGETVHLWHRGVELNERCGCGRAFSECEFWSVTGSIAFGGWHHLHVDRVESLRKSIDRSRNLASIAARSWRPRYAKLVEEYARYYEQLYDAVAQVSGAHTIIDSSKHPSLAYILATRPGIDLRIVQVIRDPRATAYSWTKRVRRPEAAESVGSEMATYPPGRAAVLWSGHNLSLSALPLLGTARLLVRYEDFVARPRDTLRRIATWSGLPENADLPITDDGVAQLSPAHTVSGNPVRFTNGTVKITPQDEWRGKLPTRDRRTVTAITLPLLKPFGYPFRVDGQHTSP